MREIKFRGRCIKTGKWLYGYYFVNRGLSYIVQDGIVNPFVEPDDFKVDPDTVGQFTGLHDAKDKEIYEDDIIRMSVSESSIGVVEWDCKHASFVIQMKSSKPRSHYEGCEIIGSIHDNSELLRTDVQNDSDEQSTTKDEKTQQSEWEYPCCGSCEHFAYEDSQGKGWCAAGERMRHCSLPACEKYE